MIEMQENLVKKTYKKEIVWKNIAIYTILHLLSFAGVVAAIYAKKSTLAWGVICYFLGGIGITAGSHRLWSHKSYKATKTLRIMLTCLASMAYENSIYEWVRDHRVHHKYTDTDADPHNSTRGFFFSHIGWLLVKKHPDVIEKGKKLDLNDLKKDKVVMFQHQYKYVFMLIFTFSLPTIIPMFWGENFLVSYLICVLRYCFILHATWAVNSFAHMFGSKPYDKNINPSENIWVSLFAAGEGFHNYHHVFPSDYQTSEYGLRFNITTGFIKFMNFFGLAYDLKKMSPELIKARQRRTGSS